MTPRPPYPSSIASLVPGNSVEVRDHYCAGWCGGFEVAELIPSGYLVRRCSDQWVLPVPFSTSEVRFTSASSAVSPTD